MEDLENNPACLETRDQVVPTTTYPMASSLNSSMDGRKIKPPNKKKFEEELEEITKQIKEKETSHQMLPKSGETPGTELRDIRAEKDAAIVKRKKIDSDLKLLNQEITKKMGMLSNTESNLHYKNEAKIDDAIKKLEWQLKVQNFKLSEEKKVVAEIDKLKRSKKHLTILQLESAVSEITDLSQTIQSVNPMIDRQYFAQKKEIDEMRDRQRRMREEREYYFKNLSNLKSKEEDIKKSNFDRKGKAQTLKKEIDELYERKRKMIGDFRKEETEYNRLKQYLRIRQRREREEEKKAMEEAFQKEIEEYQAQKEPFEDEKNLCNTLINYLQRFAASTADDCLTSPRDETTPESSLLNLSGPAQELEDGKYILLKKNEDCESYAGAIKRPNRRSRKGRKTKQLTHTPQIFAQFASLNLNAPANVSEIPASIEQLQARKRYYEEQTPVLLSRSRIFHLSGSFSSSGSMSSMESPMWERQSTWGFVEVPPAISEHQTLSDAGTSAESGFHDMSRQASKTESSESAADTEAPESIMDEIIQMSNQFSPLQLNSIDQDSQSQNSSEETLHEQSCDRDQAVAGEKESSESCSQENHSSIFIEESQYKSILSSEEFQKGDKSVVLDISGSIIQDDCDIDVHIIKPDKNWFNLNDSKKHHIKSEHTDKADKCADKNNIHLDLFSSDGIDTGSVQSNVGISQHEQNNQHSLVSSSESFVSVDEFPLSFSQVCSSDYRSRQSSIDSSDSPRQDSEITS